MKRITFNPKILGGKPIVQGTRITVDFVLELFASGMNESDILREYPQLKHADIQAVFEYAAQSLKRENIVFAS